MAAEHKEQLKNGTPMNLRVRSDVSENQNRSLTGRKWRGPDVVWLLACMGIAMGCYGAMGQRFHIETQDQSVLVGTNITIRCPLGDIKGKIVWRKGPFGLTEHPNLEGYPRYFIGSGTAGENCLFIYNVQEEDDEIYECQEVHKNKSEPGFRAHKIRLTVVHKPDPPEIKQGSFMEVTEDQPVNIECVSSGGRPATEIQWYNGNKHIKKGVENEIETLPDSHKTKTRSVLRLVPTREFHNRTIHCYAIHMGDTMTTDIHLEVKYAPKLSMSLKSEEPNLTEGTEASIRCDVDANPASLIYRWYINGNPVIGDYKEEMRIFNVTRKLNKAEVKCEVSNSIGKNERIMTLAVTYPPSFRTRPENIETDVDTSVTLRCDVEGQPQPDIVWLFHQPGRMGVKGKAPNLNIHVTNETAGRYICKATVKGYPEIESEATVFIKGPPQALSNRTQFGAEGHKVTVLCATLSVPKPDDVRWYFEGSEISVINNPEFVTYNKRQPDGVVIASLSIKSVKSKHYGDFNCSVTNEFGNANVAITLKPSQSQANYIYFTAAVAVGILIIVVFIVVFIICHRKRRQNSNQKIGNPDVTVTSADVYKESDRSSNISDLKIQLPQSDGTYELEYTTSSDRSLPTGLPLAGPVRLPKMRHKENLINFRYSNDYSDPTYSDPYYKTGFAYDYPQGYVPPSHLRVQSPAHLDVPAATRSLQGSLTRSIDTASTLPLSTGNVSQNSSLQRTKDDDETDDINRLGLPTGGDSPPPPAPTYGQPHPKNGVDIHYAATYGNPYLRNSSLGYNQMPSVKPGNPAPPPYSVTNSLAGKHTSKATNV